MDSFVVKDRERWMVEATMCGLNRPMRDLKFGRKVVSRWKQRRAEYRQLGSLQQDEGQTKD
jgi:hypothetical protein